MKSYTDIEQSKQLKKILSIETADMNYYCSKENNARISECPFVRSFKETNTFSYIYCWSLNALLNVIPKHIKDYNVLRIDINENTFALWYNEIGYGVNTELPDITRESAVDACVEMILRLHELNFL